MDIFPPFRTRSDARQRMAGDSNVVTCGATILLRSAFRGKNDRRKSFNARSRFCAQNTKKGPSHVCARICHRAIHRRRHLEGHHAAPSVREVCAQARHRAPSSLRHGCDIRAAATDPRHVPDADRQLQRPHLVRRHCTCGKKTGHGCTSNLPMNSPQPCDFFLENSDPSTATAL